MVCRTQHSAGGTPKTARTVGVEGELLLVDSESGLARSVAHQVLRVAERRGDTQSDNGKPGGSLGPELQEQQVETDTPPERDLDDLGAELVRWREKARAAAEERSEEHTSELQSLMRISYAVFCLKKKKKYNIRN